METNLFAPVTDGKVDISESSQKKERNVGSQLGKDDFLLLLVTQMKYQDPLDPTDNTEYVAQLAQFTELEYMQNMMDVTQHTSAFGLVGKYVYVEHSEHGRSQTEEGIVDYVTMKNGEAYVTINGAEFSYDDIVEVRDETYVINQKMPSVKPQTAEYLHHDPQHLIIEGVDLGKDDYQAYSMGIGIVDANGNTTQINSKYVTYEKGIVTIDKKAFVDFDAGTYDVAFVFDDPNKTVSVGDVKLEIKGIKDNNPIMELIANLPNVFNQTLEYDYASPSDITVKGIKYGNGTGLAKSVSISVSNQKGEKTKIDDSYITYKDDTATISKDALASLGLDAGKYTLAFEFDDAGKTINNGDVILTIKGTKPESGGTDTDSTAGGSTGTEGAGTV